MVQDIHLRHSDEKDFQWAFYLNRKFLSVLSVWPSDKKESRLRSSRLPLMFIAVVSGLCLPSMYALIKVQHRLDLVVDNLLITVSNSISAAKIFLLWYHRPIYALLINWSESNWSRCTENWEHQFMVKQAWRGRFLTTFSSLAVIIHVAGFLLSPVFDLGIRMINNITDPNPQRYLPVQSYYPYNCHESPYYELTYFSQVLSMCCSCLAYGSVDTFFNTLVFHACAQSEILTEKMSRLCDQQEIQSFRSRAQEVIESHNRLVRYVVAIEKSFTIIVFIQMFGCILLICSAVYAFIKAIDGTPSAKQLSVLIIAALNINEHILIYCLASEILTHNSSQLYDGIYSSTWYNLPPNQARYVTLILARAQYPLRLSAGKFFYLSMNSYVQIIKSTAGYISMLLTFS